MWPAVVAADKPNSFLLPGDLNEVYWGTAAFIVMVLVLVKYAGPAVKSGFAGRTEKIQQELEEAKAERREAEENLVAKTDGLPDLDEEEDRIMVEAHQTATKLKADIVARAETEAASIREQGRLDVENQKKQAMTEVREEFTRLTRSTAEVVIVEGLNAKSQGDLIDTYIDQVGDVA